MKNKIMIFLSLIICILVTFNVKASDFTKEVEIKQDYSSAKFNIKFPENENSENYEVTIKDSDEKKEFKATIVDKNTMECVVNDVKAGIWKIKINEINTVSDDEILDDEAENIFQDIKISVEVSSERIVDVSKDIKIATEIAGLKMYFKNNNIVVEWADTTCGDVNIDIINANTMQKIDSQVVKENKYEFEINEDTIKEIIVSICPSQSANIDGAGDKYDFIVNNHPDALVSYEDTDITNKETISANVVLQKPYSILIMNNGKEIKNTETEKAGTYDFDIPTEVGINNYQIYIIDEKGNMRSTDKVIEKDVVAPILQLKESYEGISTENESIVLEGSIDDYDTFTVNDKDVSVEGDKTFKYEYSLKEGLNNIAIVAKDRAGNIAEYDANVTRIIPQKKEIPWAKIIILCAALVLAIVYIFEIVKKQKNGDLENEIKKTKENNEPKPSKKREYINASNKKVIIQEAVNIIVPVLVAYILFNYIIQISVIQSGSMEPTIMTGDTAFYNMLAYKEAGDVERGDIISFWSSEYGVDFSKRVIGLPGDTISFQDGYVLVNGMFADESEYIEEGIETNSWSNETFTVPENSFFMLGDNREHSADSRYWKNPYVQFKDINGKLIGDIPFSIQFNILKPIKNKLNLNGLNRDS